MPLRLHRCLYCDHCYGFKRKKEKKIKIKGKKEKLLQEVSVLGCNLWCMYNTCSCSLPFLPRPLPLYQILQTPERSIGTTSFIGCMFRLGGADKATLWVLNLCTADSVTHSSSRQRRWGCASCVPPRHSPTEPQQNPEPQFLSDLRHLWHLILLFALEYF